MSDLDENSVTESERECKSNLQIVFEEFDEMQADDMGAFLERVMAEILGDGENDARA